MVATGYRGAGRGSGGACDTVSQAPAVKRVASGGEVDRARFADHRHLDLSRVLEVALDLAGDLVREQHGSVVVDLLRLHEHADLASRLECIDLLHALVDRKSTRLNSSHTVIS